MLGRKIQIIQRDGRFTMQLLEEGRLESVLATDKDGAAVGHQWWLNPPVFDLAARLRELRCSDAQIRQAYESLLSGKDTDLTLDLPR